MSAPQPTPKIAEKDSACLKWTDSRGRHHIYPLVSEELIIGRRSDADLIFNEAGVSRRHARIVRDSNRWTLFDLQSSQGVFVNGQRIAQCRLQHGDRIRFGQEGPEVVYLLRDQASTGLPPGSAELDLERSIADLSSLLPRKSAAMSDLEKLSCLLELHFNWGKNFSAEAAFQAILKSALRISGAQRGYVLIRAAEEFQYQAGMDGSGSLLEESEFRSSQSVVRHVAEKREPVFMTGRISGPFASQESIVAMNLRSIACLPLMASAADSEAGELLGILYLDSTTEMGALSSLDRRIMLKLAEEAGAVLEKLASIQAIEEQKKLHQDLIQAREIQRSLLPPATPQLGGFRIHQFNHPTHLVGGDFYDFMRLDSGEVVVMVADVAGKGVSAALLSALAQGAIRAGFQSSSRCDAVLNRVNELLCSRAPVGRFITAFVALLGPDGAGHYVSAGHNTAYLYRVGSGQIEDLPSIGLVLGAFPFASYESRPLQLGEGDVLLIYSDGLTEAEGLGGEMFGEQRLRELILREAHAGGHALERKLLESMENFTRGRPQTDDITFLLIEKGAPE